MRQRVCKRRGCGTRLSIYNPGSFCWAHTPDMTETDRPPEHIIYRLPASRDRFIQGYPNAYPFPKGGD